MVVRMDAVSGFIFIVTKTAEYDLMSFKFLLLLSHFFSFFSSTQQNGFPQFSYQASSDYTFIWYTSLACTSNPTCENFVIFHFLSHFSFFFFLFVCKARIWVARTAQQMDVNGVWTRTPVLKMMSVPTRFWIHNTVLWPAVTTPTVKTALLKTLFLVSGAWKNRAVWPMEAIAEMWFITLNTAQIKSWLLMKNKPDSSFLLFFLLLHFQIVHFLSFVQSRLFWVFLDFFQTTKAPHNKREQESQLLHTMDSVSQIRINSWILVESTSQTICRRFFAEMDTWIFRSMSELQEKWKKNCAMLL